MHVLSEAQDRALRKIQDHAPQGTWIPAAVLISILSISPRVLGELSELLCLSRKAKHYRLATRGVRAIEMGATPVVGTYVEPDHCEGQYEGMRASIRFSRPVKRTELAAASKAVARAFQGLVERVRGEA